MAGIFEAPKWDVDASSENLNRKVFGQDSRKLSKNREKRKKKGGISQNINKVFPHSAEQFQTSYSASKNINDKVKHKTFGLVKNKPEKQTDQVIDIKQQSNKRKKKLRKKRKVGDSYVHINSENVKETSKNQLQLPKNIVQRSGKKINISASEIFPKTNSLNALKRKMCAVSAEFESDLVPAKKQMVGKSDEFDLRSKKRKKKFQKTFKRNVTATTHTNSSQKVKLGLSQKDLKGIVNKAFSANSSMHGDSVNCNDQVSKKKKHKRDSRKQKDLKGIVNEGFSANLSVHADSVNYNDHVSKKKKCKRDSWNQKDSKGIVNEAFSVESSLQEDSFDPNHDVPSEIKAKKYPQKKNSIGIVNEAFSAESSFQSDNTFQYSLQMPKQEKGKKYQQKQNSGGIVNEAFSANSSIRDDSFDGRVPKKKKPTRNLEEQKNSKGIANDVFSAESSLQDDTTSRTHQILEQSKAKRDLQIEKSKGKTNEEFREHQLSQEESKPVNCIVDNPKSKKRLRVASLRERMMAKLKASRFRYLNEQIYTSESTEIHKYFANDKNAFKAYHEAFQNQVTQWPLNPLDRIINALKKKPETLVIADLGCGDARLARSLSNVVHSFDVAALSEEVTVCDMAHTPLKGDSVDVVVFCLSLMGTNLSDYLLEANRILKVGGLMKIAEVESRFEDVNKFIQCLKKYGFSSKRKDFSNNMFYFLDFKKDSKPAKRNTLPPVTLKPCRYKKR